MKTKELIENQINEIWNEFSDFSFCQIAPLSVSEITETGLIFIGINPSLDEKNKIELSNCPEKTLQFYDLDGKHKYFKKFIEIAEYANLPWGHLDLLYFRETNQDSINKNLFNQSGIDFIYKQLIVTKTLIDKLLTGNQPKIFVVNNTLAREFLGKDRPISYNKDQPHWMNYHFEWNDNIGTYMCKGHPFFFSSMLTGQRALDKGSLKRLKWHINFVKEKLEKNAI